MFDIYKEISDSLNKDLEHILDMEGVSLVFGHVCWGILTKPGAFRLTKIKDCSESNLPLTQFSSIDRIGHEKAFRKHINYFGRSGALLDWITLWMYNHISFSPQGSRTFEAVGELILKVRDDEDIPCVNVEGNSITLSRKFYDALLPGKVINQYLEVLYTHPEKLEPAYIQFATDRLIGARAVAFDMIEKDDAGKRHLASLSKYYAGTREVTEGWKAEHHNWMLIGALQTGLMYVDASRIGNSGPGGFISVASGYNVLANEKPDENPLVILSAILPQGIKESNIQELLRELRERLNGEIKVELTNIRTLNSRPSTEVFHEMRSDRWEPRTLKELISREVEDAFAVQAFPNWASALTLWLSLVTEQMRDSVHEGQFLNFSFVVADRSQIADSGLFELVDLKFLEDERLLPWDANGEPISDSHTVLKRLQREIGKKNYAWFQEGKYALLWDATFPNKHPQSLIRFKDSSWDIFISNTRMGKKSRAAEIVGAMAYVRADTGGGIIIGGKQVLSFRRLQKWGKGGGERHQRLISKLLPHLGEWAQPSGNLARVFADTLAAISDDPHGGCILVVYKKGDSPTLESMGEPWKTTNNGNPLLMSRDELTSLMSMDGATTLYVENNQPKVVFRSLVKARHDRSERKDERDLPSVSINPDHRQEHLDGEGSRKWSAAYAAMNQGTALVIAVSQDGPIYTFERKPIQLERDNGHDNNPISGNPASEEVWIEVL